MLEGCVPWPAEAAAEYRRLGLWEDLTVAEMVERTMRSVPDKTALVFGDRRISYEELVRDSRRLAVALLDLGLKPGERVVVQLPNLPEFVIAYLALNWMGAIPVMALRAHRHAEVRHFIRASGASAYLLPDVVGSFDYRPMAAEMAAEFPSLRHLIVAGEPAPGQRALDPLIAGDSVTDRESVARLAAVRPAPDEVSTMLLSGGTTSVSKLIPRTHNDYVLNARLCARAAGFDRDTVFMAILPLGHNYNLASPGLLGTFAAGGTAVIATGTDTEAIFATVERERVSVIASVVPLISGWLDSEVPKRFDLSSLKVVQNGGARLAPELRARLASRFGCTPQEIYGTAEGLINMTRLDDPRELLLESSGAPVSDHDEIKVLDDDDREVPDGQTGELVTRGPYTIRGYYNAPEKNAEAFTADGFYRMGDIVRKRGRHVFTEGRRKDLINRGGEKISCDEIENLIFGLPQVKSVALVGLPDPVFGERACACIILQPGTTLAFDELIAYLREQKIASFKLPERLEIMAEFPVSPVGKILKRELREKVLG
ncbi:(2,3-dihydroxybenzoyl)adenylate synthase [Variovorax saccharolyticus]|uniref:(2,3-dihydroxybenzoyl)adenylate synthase n=1 Tax=Variovorax saccharolyticus TaxID=3053516 RepID=UPI0025784AA2|nr:AMP-binding protein [Variovorax sp. J31P216]MDM0027070.1 AMP-binding protein [Variovorax sp. J31P216]